jgi:hypothetical protein
MELPMHANALDATVWTPKLSDARRFSLQLSAAKARESPIAHNKQQLMPQFFHHLLGVVVLRIDIE